MFHGTVLFCFMYKNDEVLDNFLKDIIKVKG